ncbi:betaine-homocysteine S-methyltransferase-like [Oratosquilla oratoria]|uniref:betaine-homocysteine S-methyltransferase-like n=1 Tax=Oratosquilla oratoria TaxID=337810 RepID=UPI003F777058
MLKNRLWVLDGGLGFYLVDQDQTLRGDPLWSCRLLSTRPEAITEGHETFLKSGAEILITNSYQASVGSFQKLIGVTEEEAKRLITKSVQLAQEARGNFLAQRTQPGPPILIAGSVGPWGACQADLSEYSGNYVEEMSEDDLKDWHRTRVELLLEAGVDLLAVETIPALKEALAVIQLLKEFPRAKAWVSFSCKDDRHTRHGEDFAEVARSCYSAGGDQLVGLGINCTSPRHVTSLLSRCDVTKDLPRVVYADSGEFGEPGQGITGKKWSREYEEEIPKWTALGVGVVGGCCRVRPEDLSIIAGVVEDLRQKATPK